MNSRQLHLFDLDDYQSFFTMVEDEFLPQEYYEIEYKSAQGGFPKEFWKTYSAFANTNTGFIVLGIAEKKEEFIVEGLSDDVINKYKKQFWDDCNNPNTVSKNLLSNDDIRTFKISEKNVLVFRIPFAQRTERPVYLTRNPFTNTYKRNHEGDYKCTDDEVKRMIADSSGELKRDSLILENYSIEDFDVATVRQFRQLFISSKPSHPWNALSDEELFKKIGATREDRKTKNNGVTLAGLLMFGKAESINEQEAVPNFFPDFREKLSTDENIRWTDRIFPDGTWENNLLQFYLKVWPKLSSTLPKPFQLKNDERIDESLTHIALREAFVNALVHTDYSLSGNIIIELDTERFVFSNPGTLLVSIAQYYEGGLSECRNPALQQMFMLIGRAEKAGSGVDKIMSGWNHSHWRKPFLELESLPDRVKLTLPMFSVLPEKTMTELAQKFDDLQNLSPDELTILAFCQIEGLISNNRLQFVLNLHSADITSILKKLVSNGYLDSDNKGRWTMYRLREKVDTSDKKVATSFAKNIENSTKMAFEEMVTSGEKVDTSIGKVATSDRKVDTSEQKVDTFKKDNKWVNEHLNKRLEKSDLEKLIMIICVDEYKKMEQVAEKIGKSVDYLKNKVFPQMIKDEKLKKQFPYTDNHPEQAYKTNENYEGEV